MKTTIPDASAPSTPSPDTSRVGAGVGCGLAILFGGWIVLGMLMSAIMQTHMSADNHVFYTLLAIVLTMPVAVLALTSAVAYSSGRRRFGKGALLALAWVPGVLVAIVAFFGLLHL